MNAGAMNKCAPPQEFPQGISIDYYVIQAHFVYIFEYRKEYYKLYYKYKHIYVFNLYKEKQYNSTSE